MGNEESGCGGDNMVRHDSASSILWNVPYVEFSVGVIMRAVSER